MYSQDVIDATSGVSVCLSLDRSNVHKTGHGAGWRVPDRTSRRCVTSSALQPLGADPKRAPEKRRRASHVTGPRAEVRAHSGDSLQPRRGPTPSVLVLNRRYCSCVQSTVHRPCLRTDTMTPSQRVPTRPGALRSGFRSGDARTPLQARCPSQQGAVLSAQQVSLQARLAGLETIERAMGKGDVAGETEVETGRLLFLVRLHFG